MFSEESHENELYLFISQVNLSHDLSNFNGNRIFVNTIIKLCMESFKSSKSDFINVKIWDSYVISSFVALWKIFNRKHSSFRFEVGFYLIVSTFSYFEFISNPSGNIWNEVSPLDILRILSLFRLRSLLLFLLTLGCKL